MDPERYPATHAYLTRLPNGVHSHPECVVKASVLRDILQSRRLDAEDIEALPEAARDLVENPRPVSAWIPEVPALTVTLMVRDRFFAPGPSGLAAYGDWVYERNRRLLARPLYRALFLLLNPTRLLRSAGRRWATFRRGVELVVTSEEHGRVRLRMQYPSYLCDETVARGVMGALRSAAELAGGRDVECEVLAVGEHRSDFEVRFR